MEEAEKKEEGFPEEQETAEKKPSTQLKKKYLYLALAVLIALAVFFIPIKGKSLFNRLLELRKEKVVNLAPNPGFEEGSGNKPAGWTTKSE